MTILQDLPVHLHQFIGEQDYERRYTPSDQAVWRYIMRQLVSQLRCCAHPVYFKGLTQTGISIEHIPSLEEMNASLAELGWRAVVVDGFIPPQAFMELQQHRILAIAVDMRSINHISYTPAPDIIHVSAGHAPIIADQEYSDYLQRFGEVGVKAMYNARDIALYEAIRQLSIIEECPQATTQEVAAAKEELQRCSSDSHPPSEMTLLGRLHWWTVEYGLVDGPEGNQLYGAGLLSSLGESLSCQSETVKKLPLTIDAILTPYDITKQQPQLFVTKSCRHLSQVLDEYAQTMCFNRGGAESVQAAIDAEVVTTCEYSSGLQVAGRFNRMLINSLGQVIYIGTEGPSQFAFQDSELDGHGIDDHPLGFSSPVGRLCNLMKPLEEASEFDLQTMGIIRHQRVQLEFLSGVSVEGLLNHVHKKNRFVQLLSFSDATVLGPKGERLFEPEWGTYDMAVGEHIRSVYPGSADRARFDVYPPASSRTTTPQDYTEQDLVEFELHKRMRELREGGYDHASLCELHAKIERHANSAWLLKLELLEILTPGSELALSVRQSLCELGEFDDSRGSLIARGLAVLDDR